MATARHKKTTKYVFQPVITKKKLTSLQHQRLNSSQRWPNTRKEKEHPAFFTAAKRLRLLKKELLFLEHQKNLHRPSIMAAHTYDVMHVTSRVRSRKSYNNVNVGSFDSSPSVVSSPALYLVIIF